MAVLSSRLATSEWVTALLACANNPTPGPSPGDEPRPPAANVQIFLSTVSAGLRSYRDALRRDLTRPNVAVAVQEDFIATGTETLDKLDDYLRQAVSAL